MPRLIGPIAGSDRHLQKAGASGVFDARFFALCSALCAAYGRLMMGILGWTHCACALFSGIAAPVFFARSLSPGTLGLARWRTGVIAFGLLGLASLGGCQPAAPPPADGASAVLAEAFAQQRSDVQVRGRGTVVKLLADDLKGSRHQRFILRLDSGQTLLIAHNIDLAPPIKNLRSGDTVEFYGEYEWNARGGVVHWTHHDPAGRHAGGWLEHQGRRYQ